jgi:hypothetical protein
LEYYSLRHMQPDGLTPPADEDSALKVQSAAFRKAFKSFLYGRQSFYAVGISWFVVVRKRTGVAFEACVAQESRRFRGYGYSISTSDVTMANLTRPGDDVNGSLSKQPRRPRRNVEAVFAIEG